MKLNDKSDLENWSADFPIYSHVVSCSLLHPGKSSSCGDKGGVGGRCCGQKSVPVSIPYWSDDGKQSNGIKALSGDISKLETGEMLAEYMLIPVVGICCHD